MKLSHFFELLLLSAIWGSSFMFMRVAAPEFGAWSLSALRMLIAALTLLPVFWLIWRKRHQVPLSSVSGVNTETVIKHVIVVGLVNAAGPAVLFAYAATTLDAGFASILNASTPLWGALVAVLLFSVHLSKLAYLGILLGFIGVTVLSANKLSMESSNELSGIVAILLATFMYGFSANYTKHNLQGVKPLFIASASLIFAAIGLLPLLFINITAVIEVSFVSWMNLLALGSFCTGVAYLFYYRIIAHSGSTNAMMVTYLIPIFGVLFGYLFLNEQLEINMLYGGLLILTGVFFTTGLISKRN